jgi:hypothetical protein
MQRDPRRQDKIGIPERRAVRKPAQAGTSQENHLDALSFNVAHQVVAGRGSPAAGQSACRQEYQQGSHSAMHAAKSPAIRIAMTCINIV